MLLQDSAEKREEVREREWRRGGWGVEVERSEDKEKYISPQSRLLAVCK